MTVFQNTRFNQRDGQLQTLGFDGLMIDFNNRSIHAVNGDYELPPKEFDLLLLLAKNQGKILTKQQIYENVWGEDYVYDERGSFYISGDKPSK